MLTIRLFKADWPKAWRAMIEIAPVRLIADDPLGRLRAMLVGVVLEVGEGRFRAGDQHLGDVVQRVAHMAEELMLAAHLAAVLLCVVVVRLDLLCLHMFGVELQDLRLVVVNQDNGVEQSHLQAFRYMAR